MTNILLNNYALDASWCFDILKRHIKPASKVLVLPFSFHEEEVRSERDVQRYYGKHGKYYDAIVDPLLTFGIKEEDISIVNYYSTNYEELSKEIKNSDIIYFTGGLPDKMIERIEKLGIKEELRAYTNLVIGCSAGAMVQLDHYHITPDEDYSEYCYGDGIGYFNEFDIEVHYDCSYAKKMAIRRALMEEKKDIYALGNEGGLLIEDGQIQPIGHVTLFEYK
ncbi:MAG: Type 1 glutamine amidotransferase-like domain-containing protein [bacterium]|nr:Type 1 glutamine amidotransferase-like domain-containing protein [bacterium]